MDKDAFLEDLLETLHKVVVVLADREEIDAEFSLSRELAEQLCDEIEAIQEEAEPEEADIG